MQLTTNIDHFKKKVESAELKLTGAQQVIEKENRKLSIMIEGASKFCPERLPNEQIKFTTTQIQSKIENLKNQLMRMQEEFVSFGRVSDFSAGMGEEDTRAKFLEASEQYKTAQTEMNNIAELLRVFTTPSHPSQP
jgi:uncharacterized protein YhaN